MSPYASAKCGADRLVYSYCTTYKIPAVIMRPFNNFGPRQHLEKAVPRFISSVLLEEPLTVHGDGSAARDFLHVSDLCRAVSAVIESPRERVVGEVFNVATGVGRTILSVAEDIVRFMDADPALIQFVGERAGQVFRHTGNSDKIKCTLDWQCRMSWKEGIEETIAWFRENRPTWQRQLWLRKVQVITASGAKEFH
jgi:dTDP-glucose 4,6-dehydratase